MPCPWCRGSKRSFVHGFEKADFRKTSLRCTVCNANGLVVRGGGWGGGGVRGMGGGAERRWCRVSYVCAWEREGVCVRPPCVRPLCVYDVSALSGGVDDSLHLPSSTFAPDSAVSCAEAETGHTRGCRISVLARHGTARTKSGRRLTNSTSRERARDDDHERRPLPRHIKGDGKRGRRG